jgi:SAM-dependent methyltransferase
MTDTDLGSYFAGDRLYGDDFTTEQIDDWFAAEASAYTDITGDNAIDEYGYTQWAVRYGFRHLPAGRRFRHVVGFGSGRGNELESINGRCERITIIESSDRYSTPGDGLTAPTEFVRAQSSGDIALDASSADLLVCLGVLHHIPNVSHVVGEFARILEPDGYAIVREPITSMGDWRRPRPGLTPHERGIPRTLLRGILADAGFTVEHEALIGFPLIANTWRWFGRPPYNNGGWTLLDRVVCVATTPNLTYHATSRLRKFRPTSSAIVARRQ